MGRSSTAWRASLIASSFRPKPASEIAAIAMSIVLFRLAGPFRVHFLSDGCNRWFALFADRRAHAQSARQPNSAVVACRTDPL